MDKFVDNHLAKSLQLAHSEGRRHDMSGSEVIKALDHYHRTRSRAREEYESDVEDAWDKYQEAVQSAWDDYQASWVRLEEESKR